MPSPDTTYIESAVSQVEEGARFVKQGWDDSLPHVQSPVRGVFYTVHEDVALLGVPVEIDEQQHLAAGASKRKPRGVVAALVVIVVVLVLLLWQTDRGVVQSNTNQMLEKQGILVF